MLRKSIIALIFIAIAGMLYFLLSQPTTPTGLDQEQRQKDLAVVKDTASKDVDVYQALGRMARSKDSEALAQALSRAKDPARITREGAANALGYFTDDKAFAALEALLQDPEPNVRIRTLQALANAKENRRLELIVRYLDREEVTLKEKIVGNSVLARIATEDEAKAVALQELRSIAKGGDDLDHHLAFSKVTELAPRDVPTIELARSKLDSSNNPEIVAHAIRHLSAVEDSYLKSRLPKYIKNQDPRIRAAAEAAANKK